MRPIPDGARKIVREFEGLRLKAYLCPAGLLTIGYGHTMAVQEGQTCTKRQAELWLTDDLAVAARRLRDRIGPVVDELTENQYGALLSFVFNLGANPDWTIWKKLKARDFDAVPAQIARFVYSGKVKLKGLVRRRNAEIELWSDDEPGSADEEVVSAVTRQTETPPAPAEKPKAAPIVTAAVSACAAVPVAAKQVTDALSPYADASPIVGQAVALVATLAAGAAVGALVLTWIQRRNAGR